MSKLVITERGFARIEFADAYGEQCSIQESSAMGQFLWLGIDDANPQIMASVAGVVNPATGEVSGCVPYPVPSEVVMTTRMHLSRDGVRELIAELQAWLDTGTLGGDGR